MEGKITKSDLGNGAYRLDLANMIDEELKFPEDFNGLRSLTIDLGAVTYINSSGIRNWVRWMEGLQKKAAGLKIEFLRIPLPFVRAIEVVRLMLPDKAVVHSFNYDVFCEDCNEELSQLVTNTAGTKLPEIKCPKCGAKMQSELKPEAYMPLTSHKV